jgi:hypothetical protein
MDLRTWILADHEAIGTRFATTVADHVPRDRWRERAGEGGSSIASLLYHMALHEDLAITTVVGAEPPLLERHRDDLGLQGAAPQAGVGETEDPTLTDRIDLDALAVYWRHVRNHTVSWLATADLATLDDVPPASDRVARLAGLGDDEVPWLHRMWTDRPVHFFVRWEALGHPQGHLGEMISLRSRLGLSPF